jgi:hypothetical protein
MVFVKSHPVVIFKRSITFANRYEIGSGLQIIRNEKIGKQKKQIR